MKEIIETFNVQLTFNVVVDKNTGEITTECTKKLLNKKEDKIPNKTSSIKTKIDNRENPRVILESNKLCLNDAAISLIGVSYEDRIDVKYDKGTPIIGIDENKGNKLTKSNTVACRGKKFEQLSKYGTVFDLVEYGNGLFKMIGDSKTDIPIEKDDNIEESIEDFNIDSLLDDGDVTEIDSNFFKL